VTLNIFCEVALLVPDKPTEERIARAGTSDPMPLQRACRDAEKPSDLLLIEKFFHAVVPSTN
jgi:hypothetical protein